MRGTQAEWQSTASKSEESDAKRPRRSTTHQYESSDSLYIRRSVESGGGLIWLSTDIALAGRLLASIDVTFVDDEEKRRVFTLVYDVLRYKSILNQALTDLHFFVKHPQFKDRCYHVWLLFFDLYKRDFKPRDVLEPRVDTEFQEQGLFEIDEALWKLRVRLAATVSRLRIKNGAHSLSVLLPIHLQQTRSSMDQNVITGWVNGFKNSLDDVSKSIESMNIKSLEIEEENLQPMTYKTDHLLPRFLHVMPAYREDIVHLPIILEHHLILQERTFCIGPAVMAQLLKDFSLTGIVAQTHVNSMVTTAYFANLLLNNEKIEMLHVFGAGNKKNECIKYLQDLGVNNTEVHEENFADLSPDNCVLNNIIGVLVAPPNTNSSVVDPVDLAVARGGDLEILHQLTNEDFSSVPTGNSIEHLLIEQKETLRRAMSKPQIQFVVYETHSRFDCENTEMTNTLIEELNTYARDAHIEEMRKTHCEKLSQEQSESHEGEDSVQVAGSEEVLVPMPPPNVMVPPSDLFELGPLPDLCPGDEKCLDPKSEGIYLAIIKRKEITKLDPKYMIQMAESRGLFGRSEEQKPKLPSASSKTKITLAALQSCQESSSDSKKGSSKSKVEIDRIAAPTRSSFLKDFRTPVHVDEPCPRHANHLSQDGKPKVVIRIERKNPLTPAEEEELIRRLYRTHRFSKISKLPKVESLPPLEIWGKPMAKVESDIQKRLFNDRLSTAIEFNKNNCVNETSSCPNDSTVTAFDLRDLLSAMRKLSETTSEMELLWKQKSSNYKENIKNDDADTDESQCTHQREYSNRKSVERLFKSTYKDIELIENVLVRKSSEDQIEEEEEIKFKQRLLNTRNSFIFATLRLNGAANPTKFTQTNFSPKRGRVSFERKNISASSNNTFC